MAEENIEKIALVIVDMQKYYLSKESDFIKYFETISPGSSDYIMKRSYRTVIPNILKLKEIFRNKKLPVIYLRLCSRKKDRRDLQYFFKESHELARERGFNSLYPLYSEEMADVVDELKPDSENIVIDKTTFSAFTSTKIEKILKKYKVKTLVFTGLATSQCVETTARDASERNFSIIHINDAQADYDEITHNASLYSSRGVCGGAVYNTDDYIDFFSKEY